VQILVGKNGVDTYSGTTLHTNPLEFADISNYSYDSPPMLLSFFFNVIVSKSDDSAV